MRDLSNEIIIITIKTFSKSSHSVKTKMCKTFALFFCMY